MLIITFTKSNILFYLSISFYHFLLYLVLLKFLIKIIDLIYYYFFSVTKESIVDVLGKIQTVEAGVAGCTQQDVELVASEFWIVSASVPQLPLQIEDASRPEKTEV